MLQIMNKVKNKNCDEILHGCPNTQHFFNNGQYTTDTLSFPDSERTEIPNFGKCYKILY